jgi:hypothetical protein
MNGRAIVTFILGLIVVGILVGAGVGIYQAGLAQGVVDAGRIPAGAVVPVAGYGYGYGWGFHGGFGFLGLLFPILFLFLIFGLIRAAFSRGRGLGPGWGGHGYWGKGYGPGYRGPGGPGGAGGPEAWREERDRQISDLHRRLHDEEAGSGSTGSSQGSGPSGSAR